LNIYPPGRTAPASEPIERTIKFVESGRRTGAGTDGLPPFDIGTGDAGWLGGRELTRHVTAPVGLVAIGGRTVSADDMSAPNLRDAVDRGLDPLAIRLAFLGQRYRDELDLTWDALHTAGETLLRWRERVAEWALSPSAAMSRRYADAITEAFGDDLNTPAALRELHAMEADDSAAAGAKFETFAAMDRLLGLDLARDVGKVTAARQP
jgi:cysteinyl-tRNA synthetase